MIAFDLFASGSKGNSCLIRTETTALLIDCGTTKKYLSQCFERAGITVNDLDGVLITHDHSDHVSQVRFFRERPVYSPVGLPDIPVRPVHPLEPFAIGDIDITPLALSHDAPDTVGYILRSGDHKMVYVTDTGYVPYRYLPMMTGADYIILESNHDVDMLMKSRRPGYVKSRIYSDSGHLCNEDCAAVLDQIVTEQTRMIVLAHISQEANTREKALEVSAEMLRNHSGALNRDLILSAAGQFEVIRKGADDEKVDGGTVCRFIGMEHMAQR